MVRWWFNHPNTPLISTGSVNEREILSEESNAFRKINPNRKINKTVIIKIMHRSRPMVKKRREKMARNSKSWSTRDREYPVKRRPW